MKNDFKNPGTQFPTLLPDEVHVWKMSLRAPPDLLPKFFETLSVQEQARAKRFVFERDEHRYVVAHAGLRYLISKYVGANRKEIHIATERLGKPYIQQVNTRAQFHFNLSHSGDLAAMAFCVRGELGIDIEQKRPEAATMEIAERNFSERELRELKKLSTEDRLAGFFRCWTRKEAYVKAKGIGLGADLRSFHVNLDSDDVAELNAVDAEKWNVFPFKANHENWGAVVYPKSLRNIKLWELGVQFILEAEEHDGPRPRKDV
jgi:4'-phosphopantetheinyl transferase